MELGYNGLKKISDAAQKKYGVGIYFYSKASEFNPPNAPHVPVRTDDLCNYFQKIVDVKNGYDWDKIAKLPEVEVKKISAIAANQRNEVAAAIGSPFS